MNRLSLFLSSVFLLVLLSLCVSAADANLVLNMTFDSKSNTTGTYDFSMYGNTGAVYGATYSATKGINGGGAYKMGSGTTINHSDNKVLSITKDLTISLWVNQSTSGGDTQLRFVDKYNSPLSRAYYFGIDRSGGGCAGNVTFVLSSNAGSFSGEILCANTPLSLNQWHYVTAVYNSSVPSMKIYIDGIDKTGKVSSGSVPASIADGTSALGIGAQANKLNYFIGWIDEVKIYNKTLSSAEILSDYNSYFPAAQTEYYFSQSGSDSNDCTIGSLCQYKFKTISFNSGDTLHFKTDDKFVNASFTATSGTHITSFGTGALPELWGAENRSKSTDWTNGGSGNVWNTTSSLESLPIYNGSIVATKTSTAAGLNVQGESYWDSTKKVLSIYSTSNPSSYYDTVYIALEKDIISIENKNHVLIDHINLKYGGKHAIQGATTSNIIIRNISMSYIGGTYQTGTLRYGNGIQFWNGATNNLVEYSNISYIYDACITNQGTSGIQSNITYRYNVLTNSEYGIEMWLDNNLMTDINVTQNTFYNMGSEKYIRASPYPVGIKINTLIVGSDITISNNIIYNTTYRAIDTGMGSTKVTNGTVLADYDLFVGDYLFTWNGTGYATLAALQVSKYAQELNGLQSDPLFTDAANGDFRPQSNSPACTMSSTGSYVGALPCSELPYSVFIQFNYTPTASGGTLDDCIFYVNNVYDQIDRVVSDGVINSFNKTFYEDGKYNWTVWCNESTGTGDYSAMGVQTFYIDSVSPVFNITYPLPQNYTIPINHIAFDASEELTNLDTCWYSLDNAANQTTSCTANISIIANLGEHTIWLWGNDSAGNIGEDYQEFNVSTALYSISFVEPTPESGNYSGTTLPVSVSGNGHNVGAIVIYLYNETSLVAKIINSTEIAFSYNFINLPLTTYYLNATINETDFAQVYSTETRIITLIQADTCTYSGAGAWIYQCKDNCIVSNDINFKGYNWRINGTGTFTGMRYLRNYTTGEIFGPCYVVK